MKLDNLRSRPFLLIILRDGISQGYFSDQQLQKINKQLVDMSLQLANGYFSPVIRRDLQHASEIVLGITSLGLLRMSDGDEFKARAIVESGTIVNCFRRGWSDVTEVVKLSREGVSRASAIILTQYRCRANEHKNLYALHEELLAEQQQIAVLDAVYEQFNGKENTPDLDDYDIELAQQDILRGLFDALWVYNKTPKTRYQDIADILQRYSNDRSHFLFDFDTVAGKIINESIPRVAQALKQWLPALRESALEIVAELDFGQSKAALNLQFIELITTTGILDPEQLVYLYDGMNSKEKTAFIYKYQAGQVLDEYDDLDDESLLDLIDQSGLDIDMDFGDRDV